MKNVWHSLKSGKTRTEFHECRDTVNGVMSTPRTSALPIEKSQYDENTTQDRHCGKESNGRGPETRRVGRILDFESHGQRLSHKCVGIVDRQYGRQNAIRRRILGLNLRSSDFVTTAPVRTSPSVLT